MTASPQNSCEINKQLPINIINHNPLFRMSNNELLQLISDRSNCRSPISDHLTLPNPPYVDELQLASGNNEYEDAVIYFRRKLGEYILSHAAFFTDKIVVPLVRDLRFALQQVYQTKLDEYASGLELDRGFSREILETYIQITKSVNLGCRKAKRSRTLKRIFKLLDPYCRRNLKHLQVTHVEVEIGLNFPPSPLTPETQLENYIAQRRLCGTGIENILRLQLEDSRENETPHIYMNSF